MYISWKNIGPRLFLVTLAVLAFSLAWAEPTKAETITVTTTIQAAIDASAASGDTILVTSAYVSSAEEVFPINFDGHASTTLSCDGTAPTIGPTGTTTPGQIQMTTGGIIQNCSFSLVDIVNNSYSANPSVLNNTFATSTTSTIILYGVGTIDVSHNIGLNGILFGGFTSGTIHGNEIDINFDVGHQSQGILVNGFVNGVPTSNITISNNTIYKYITSERMMDLANGLGNNGNSNILVTNNYFGYPVALDDGVENSVMTEGITDVTFTHNYFDTHLVPLHDRRIIVLRTNSTAPENFVFDHNTFVMNSTNADDNTQIFDMDYYDGADSGFNITSTYNIYADLGSRSDASFVNADGGTSINWFISHDAFWHLTDLTDYTSLADVYYLNNPGFKISDSDAGNDLELAPFSPYLDLDRDHSGSHYVGAYGAGVDRRNTINIDANTSTVDYVTVDATSTVGIGSALLSGDTLNLAAGTYNSISISSSSLTTSSITVQGAGAGTVISAGAGESGISLTGIDSAMVKDLVVQNASSTGAVYNMTQYPFEYDGNLYDSCGDGSGCTVIMTANTGNPMSEFSMVPAGVLDVSSIVGTPPQDWNLGLMEGMGMRFTMYFRADQYSSALDAYNEWKSVLDPEETAGVEGVVAYWLPSIFQYVDGQYIYNIPTGDPAPTTSPYGDLAINFVNVYHAGIKISDGTGNTIENVTSTGNYRGVWFFGSSSDNTVSSSVFIDNVANDIYSDTDGPSNSLYNTSFDITSSSITGAGVIDVYFKARGFVTSSVGGAIEGATVNFVDGNNTATTTVVSGADGFTPFTDNLLAWIMTSSSPTSTTNGGFNPFTITATANGYEDYDTQSMLIQPNETLGVTMTPSGGSAPTSLSNLTATTFSATEIDLSWDSFDGASYYNVYYGGEDGASYTFTASTTGYVYENFLTLTPSTTNYFVVAAVDGSDVEIASSTVSSSTWPMPDAPTGLVAIPTSSTEIDLTWDAVSYFDHNIDYYVYYSTTSAEGPFESLGGTMGNTWGYHTDLTPSTTYYYKVASVSGNAINTSTAVSTTTLASGDSAPATPTNVTLSSVATSAVTLSWDAMDRATSYTVSTTAPIGTTSTMGTSIDFTGLIPNHTYYFQVKASNTGGDSNYSTVVNTTTVAAIPSTPEVSNISTSSLTLTWSSSLNYAGTVYYILDSHGGHTTTTATTTNLTDLTPNTTYQFQVRAENLGSAGTYSDYSASSTVTSTLNLPAGVTVSETTAVVTEDGATDSYTVVLDSAPTANVVITISTSDSKATVSPTSLTFTTENYLTPQTVTVTAVDNSSVDGTHYDTISHSASSTDLNYHGISIGSVAVTITDNDSSGGGGGGGGTYVQPITDFTITTTPATVNSQIITLKLYSARAVLLAVSEDRNFVGASWQTFASTTRFILSAGNGLKTIYAKVRAADGGESVVKNITVTLSGNTSGGGTTGASTTTPTDSGSGPVLTVTTTGVYFNVLPSTSTIKRGKVLSYSYIYPNTTGKAQPIKVYRQMLNSKGKAVISSSAVTTLKKGTSFKRSIKDTLSKTLPVGVYTIKVRVMDAKNKLISEASFKESVIK